jgi:hypothetical protein
MRASGLAATPSENCTMRRDVGMKRDSTVRWLVGAAGDVTSIDPASASAASGPAAPSSDPDSELPCKSSGTAASDWLNCFARCRFACARCRGGDASEPADQAETDDVKSRPCNLMSRNVGPSDFQVMENTLLVSTMLGPGTRKCSLGHKIAASTRIPSRKSSSVLPTVPACPRLGTPA